MSYKLEILLTKIGRGKKEEDSKYIDCLISNHWKSKVIELYVYLIAWIEQTAWNTKQ